MSARVLELCADDFGQGAAVDRGITALADGGRLSAVSCMSNGTAWTHDAPALARLPAVAAGRVRLGLHFNLTHGEPLSASLRRLWPRLPGLPRLLLQAHAHALPVDALRDELRAQLDAFQAATGRAPAHLDGHQHIHHLPQLRPLVLQAAAGHPGLRVRSTARPLGPGHGFKRAVIRHSGGRALDAALRATGREANSLLLGVYDFRAADYGALMRRWLRALPERGALLFCHPGDGQDADDPIGPARAREFAYLAGPDFARDLADAGVALGHAR